MRIAIVAAHIEDVKTVRDIAQKMGFTYDKKNPELIICYGGDGTFLRAERQYPSIPKLPTRKSRVCRKCHDFPLDIALQKVAQGAIKKIILPKLKAYIKTHNQKLELLAVNDIAIRNVNLAKALRFSISIDKKHQYEEVIGDGVVIATPFGSTAYYHSVTGSTIEKGFSLAFNNTTEQLPPMNLDQEEILLTIIRGPAQLSADNFSPDIELYENETVKIMLSDSKAIVYQPID